VSATGDGLSRLSLLVLVYREEHPEPVNDSSFVRLAIKADKEVACEVVFTDGTKVLFRESVSVQHLKSLLF
jgi:hypothetical protein